MTPEHSIERIEQTNAYNCGVACLAMVLGVNIDSAEELIGREIGKQISGFGGHPDFEGRDTDDYVGVMPVEIDKALGSLKIASRTWRNRASYEGTWVADHWSDLSLPDEAWLSDRLIEEGCGILAVESLNSPGGLHWVVWDEGRIIDPSPKKRYPEFPTDLPVCDAVIIRKVDLIKASVDIAA